MTREEIYNFVTGLLDGYEMDVDVFNSFLDTAQAIREGQRPWVALRTENTSQTVTAGNTFETQKTLPANFRKWYTRFPIVLTDSLGNAQRYLREIPINMKSAYKGDASRFYADYFNKKFYVCGDVSQTFTARLYYIRKTEKISEADENTWELDPNDEYTKILAYDVAVLWKKGVDYDVISNPQADMHGAAAGALFHVMEEWDAELAESGLQGMDYGSIGSGRYMSEAGGSLGLLG